FVVVSHADPIKSAVAHYTGMHLDLFQRVNISPASATVFELHAYGVVMLTCNETGGLGDMLAPPPPPAASTDEASDESGEAASSDGESASAAAETAHA
ncbi:MAG TPA: histidine phosphatase family protein, partial [Acidimicrobiia bacterium]